MLVISRTVLATFMGAVLSWVTAKVEPWSFVQATGGIRVMQPVRRGERMVLPVEYDVSGMQAVTCRPTLVNSALAIRKIRVDSQGDRLWISVVACLVEPGLSAGGIHYADVSDLKPGVYQVYYGRRNDTTHEIGVVTVSPKSGSGIGSGSV